MTLIIIRERHLVWKWRREDKLQKQTASSERNRRYLMRKKKQIYDFHCIRIKIDQKTRCND